MPLLRWENGCEGFAMGAVEDLAVIARQEEVLRWDGFDADVAWRLGGVMREMLRERGAGGAGGTVEIEVAGQVLFTAATVGATPGQADWIRRKRNTVRRFARSSYAVGRLLERDGETMEGAAWADAGGLCGAWRRVSGVGEGCRVCGLDYCVGDAAEGRP